MALVQTGAAQADPAPGAVEAQIDAQWNQLEGVIEQHNLTKMNLDVNRAKLADIRRQLDPLQLQVDLALSKISAISAQYYMGGRPSTINAVLSSGSPTQLADQLSLLNQLARTEQDQIKDVVSLKTNFDQQRKPLDALVTKLTAQEADLAAQEKGINDEINRLNALRIKVYGTTGDTGSLRPAPCPFDYVGGPGVAAAKIACAQIGKPYVFGADGPGTFDCSGLTMYAWAGKVSLPHNAAAQYRQMKHVTAAALQPGDLIFMNGLNHVGIYVGGGYMVHAPHSGADVTMRKYQDGDPIVGYGRPG